MDGKKRKIVKTLYVENGKPLRIEITSAQLIRINKLQALLQTLPLEENNEAAMIELYLKKGTFQIRKNSVDLGKWGYDGWDSYLSEMNLRKLDNLPEVFFSSMFLYYMKKDSFSQWRPEVFKKLILPQHKELLVWKKISGEV